MQSTEPGLILLANLDCLGKAFAPNDNSGEKLCAKILLTGLFRSLLINISDTEIEKIVSDIVDKIILPAAKGYSLDKIQVWNPKLVHYGQFQEISKSYIADVNREIAEFILRSGDKPGKYKKNDAIQILDKIFLFLQKKLEAEISNYSESVLHYAYKELEFIEGHRAKMNAQFGRDANKYITYNISEKYRETQLNIAKHSNAARYIIQIILKTGIKGKKAIVDENWLRLQAISTVLHETSNIYDYIFYDIIPHELIINDLYEITISKINENFDHESFYKAETDTAVSIEKSIAQLKLKTETNSSDTTREPVPLAKEFEEIDAVFLTEFGFTFDDLYTTLINLHALNITCHYEPLNIISENNLIKELITIIPIKIEDIKIRAILRFISLSFSSYKPDESLIPALMLLRKERITICPLIKLENNDYLFGNQMCLAAANLWHNKLKYGEMPYKIEDSNSNLAKALTKVHRKLDLELEKDAEKVAVKTLGGNNVEGRIRNFKRLSTAFSKSESCGEIDLIAVNKTTEIIFVFEVKNRNCRTRCYDIYRDIKIFFDGDKAYIHQLNRKVDFVKNNLTEILKHFKITYTNDWQLYKAFIVKHNFPVTYTNHKEVDFVILDDLPKYLLKK